MKKLAISRNIIIIISLLIYSYFIFIGRNQYIYNISYQKSIIFALLITLIIYLSGLIINTDKTYKTNINLYILLYFILLISVTFYIGRDTLKLYNWWYAGQYKPFFTITQELNYGTNLSILKNIIGNSVMLIPLSFLLMLKNKKYNNIFKQTLIILPTIISIEILQAFTHTGSFDIDDIILNYFGVIIFTFLITRFSLIEKIKKLFFTDYKIPSIIKYLMYILSIILLIIYIILLFQKITI